MTTARPRKRRPKGPGRLSAEETALLSGRLLDAAQSVFIEMGYARATMDAIAKEAGASRKTIYARYANKAEVLTAVVNRLLDTALAPHEAVPVSAPAVREPRALLMQIAHEISGLSSTPQVAGLNRLIMAEAAQVPELAQLFINLHERATDNIGRSLERLKADGHLAHLPPTNLAAMLFIEMVDSVPRLRALLGKPLSKRETEALITTAVDLFLRGCGYDRSAA
jgi:AcrR family transcriptional regulator